MAFYRTGGGGSATETVLWTNGSPTAQFAPQDVTLSDDIDNYDFLKIEFISTASTGVNGSILVDVSDFKSMTNTANVAGFAFGLSSGADSLVSRKTTYVSDTKIHIGNAYSYAGGTNNARGIPLQIIGIKL